MEEKYESEKIYIECECGVHTLQVESGIDYFENDKSNHSYYLAMYTYGSGKRTSWKYRLRHIWNIITKGDAYSDQLVLTPEEAKKLADFITENLSTK